MKILLVHPALMDYRVELFNLLNEKYDITFAFTKHGRGQNNIKENHLCVPGNYKSKIMKTNHVLFKIDIGMYYYLAKEILFGKHDLILISNSRYICWPIAKLAGKKIVVWTEFWYYENTSFYRKILNSYTKFIMSHSDAIIATGSKVFESVVQMGVPEFNIKKYPQCSVDYRLLNCFDDKIKYEFDNKKIILYCGRIIKRKGLDVLIRALSYLNNEIDNLHMVVIGTGPFEIYCKELATQLQVNNITFMGYIEDCFKISLFKQCDVFVMPSVFYQGSYEPWGLVINEIMAFGKPIIATKAVGSAFDLVIDDYNGYIIDENNVDTLVNALRKVLCDSGKKEKMGENSLKMFDNINSYPKLAACFESAINYANE